MKLPDVNLLLSGAEPVGFTWSVLLAFVRLSTHPRLFSNPLTPAEAFAVVEGWLAQPCAIVLHATDRHVAILRGLVESLGTAGNITTDAHLATLAIEHGGEVFSADADFARFPGLRWTHPLVTND